MKLTYEMVKGDKMTLEQIKECVIRDGFSLCDMGYHNDDHIYFTRGFSYATTTQTITIDEVIECLNKFQGGDYGTFYEVGETATNGNEYGEYKSNLGATANDGAIMIHRERGYILVYFQFER